MTKKFLIGLAYCDHVVNAVWAGKCTKAGYFVREEDCTVKPDAEHRKLEKALGFKLETTIENRQARTTPIFSGFKIFTTAKINPAFKAMFVAHGGKAQKTAPKKPPANGKLIVLAAKKDPEAKTLAGRAFVIRDADWVKAAILRQSLPADDEFVLPYGPPARKGKKKAAKKKSKAKPKAKTVKKKSKPKAKRKRAAKKK